jgi:phage/plasmid-associated DNA primase
MLGAFLLSLVGGNKTALEILRGAIRRAIQPSILFQTGVWIYGPPRTGKSSLVNWLMTVVNGRAVEMSCRTQGLFERERLKSKSLIVISDGESLNFETVRLLRRLLGRDNIAFDRKYENVTTYADKMSLNYF